MLAMSDQEDQAKQLLEEGRAAFKSGIYDSSVSMLGEACQLLDTINGDLSNKNGDAYFLYGQALLQYAIQQNSVLGQSAQANADVVEEQQEAAKEEAVESSNPLVQIGSIPDFTTSAATAPTTNDDDDDEEEEEEAELADDDFETAWDILDVARVIFEKSEDKETQLKLADVHLCLGDVSLETEKFNEALADYEKAINIKQIVLEDDDRELAEAHYKYALALEFSTDKAEQAVPELQKAVIVLKKRVEKLLQTDEGKGKGKIAADPSEGVSQSSLDEIKEINELIPDMELKIEELTTRQATEKEAEDLLKAMLGNGSLEKAKQIAESTPVNDLSSFVKRKVKEDVKLSEKEETNKKHKTE